MRPLHKKTKNDKKEKAAINKLYDFTKGGTDIVDQMNDCYTTRAKTLRWSTLGFYYMLDTIRVNAKSLWCIKHGKDQKKANTFDVGLDLAHSLVILFIQQRSLVGLRKPLLKKINYTKITNFHQKQSSVEKKYPAVGDRKRYETCKTICGTKAGKNKLGKSKEQSEGCGESVCRLH